MRYVICNVCQKHIETTAGFYRCHNIACDTDVCVKCGEALENAINSEKVAFKIEIGQSKYFKIDSPTGIMKVLMHQKSKFLDYINTLSTATKEKIKTH